MNKIAFGAFFIGMVILTSGLASAQFGTKVAAGDPDVGLPLSLFSAVVGVPAQTAAFVAYWDIGSTPGIFDDQDVAYLQFGSVLAGSLKIVREGNIRLEGWGPYPAGSQVKPADGDIGQQLIPLPPLLPSGIATGFYYLNVMGGPGYDLGDPVYLKTNAPAALTLGTNDIRITAFNGFPAGSRVSLADPDAGKLLTAFKAVAATGALAPAGGLIGQLAFYNANGNIQAPLAPIYDDGDQVYLDVPPLGVVSPNDVRLF